MNTDVPARAALAAWLDADAARSQSSLARKLSLRQSAVSLWIRGSSRPEPHLREALALITGIPAADWETTEERALVERVRGELDETPQPPPSDPPPPPRGRSIPPPARTPKKRASKPGKKSPSKPPSPGPARTKPRSSTVDVARAS
jgi:transcriptional regulator with XRE-family HTH domain